MANKEIRNLRPLVAGEPIKTPEDWTDDFEKCFFPGDRVTEEIPLYFAEVVPGGLFEEENYSQCGEPTDSVDGKFIYTTFIYDGTSWIYSGNCFRGEKEEPGGGEHGE